MHGKPIPTIIPPGMGLSSLTAQKGTNPAMKTYRLTLTWRGERITFICKADNLSHAKEQARNAYPYCRNLQETQTKQGSN